MKRKKIRISIGKEYVDITIDFDKEETYVAGYAFYQAYTAGDIKVEIEDIDNEEQHHDKGRLQ